MSAHTPGPWTVEGEETQPTCCCASEKRVGITGSGRAIAQALGDETDPETYKERCTPEAHANARLIAAAPELLAALKHERWCRACADDGCANCNDCTYEAAIAKAEGR